VILAADVVGYSALMERNEEGTYAEFERLKQELIEPSLSSHDGRLIKTTGDGALAEFASPSAAVRCAVEIQESIASGRSSLELRIGVNLGEVIVAADGDLFGDGINIAVRLEGVADPGSILISEKVYSEVDGKLDLAFEDRGEQQLKNISKPVRTYAVRVGAYGAPIDRLSAAPSLPDKPSIAVLPFENMGGDPEQEYFADGMVEDIITALSRFKSLLVIARNSSFTYKGKAADLKQIGRELGVRYVLEGSVRKSGSRLRISGQLIEAATGSHIWAEKIDGPLEDVFDLQDRVTQSIVGAILPNLMQAEMVLASRKPPSTWNCYDRYLRANALLFKFSPITIDEAKEEYQRALLLDPDFPPAVAMLSTCYVVQRFLYGQDLRESELLKALELSARAAELAPDDGMVLSLCALTTTFLSDDLEKATILAERAVSLNPNISMSWAALGWIYNWLGEPERACEAFDRAARLNPLDKIMLVTHILPGTSLACFLLGRQDLWVMCVKRLLALDPNNLSGLLDALDIARQQGRNSDAEKLLQRIEAVHPGLRSSQVRDIFRRLRNPEHQALFDQWLNRLALPE
jgi:adenylate cyclase